MRMIILNKYPCPIVDDSQHSDCVWLAHPMVVTRGKIDQMAI
jgi:hypothetical protein